MPVERLKKRSDFLILAAHGQRDFSSSFVMQASPIRSSDASVRIGFTVTKKLFKLAVLRNRAKRRMREVARLSVLLPQFGGYDVVLIARAGVVDRPFDVLRGEFEGLLQQIMDKKNAVDQ